MENSEQPAFGYGYANEQSHQEVNGLSKREYFAGLAMQGILANSALIGQVHDPNWVAQNSVLHSDVLLKKLEK